jgi:hypothetical protein
MAESSTKAAANVRGSRIIVLLEECQEVELDPMTLALAPYQASLDSQV